MSRHPRTATPSSRCSTPRPRPSWSAAATSERNHVWIRGLQSDTEYRYRVRVDGESWGDHATYDWVGRGGRPELTRTDRTYDLRFRTFPAPDVQATLRFAILGDYGVGILASDEKGKRQLRLAEALDRAVRTAGVRLVLTTGDNVYIGAEDSVDGTGESEISDNRDQLADNFFTDLRFGRDVESRRASVDPGLYYRFAYGADVEFVCIDTTEADIVDDHRYFFDIPRHRDFLESSFPADGEGRPWRIPFTHHPPYCAGPKHHDMDPLIEVLQPLIDRSGVQLVLSGHEHNFQHHHREGVDYLVTGASGKLRTDRPDRLAEVGNVSWAAEGHFLVVDVGADAIVIHPVTDVGEDGSLVLLEREAPDGTPVTGPIVISRR